MALTQEQRDKIKILREYRQLSRDIDRSIRELEEAESKKYSITSILSDMPKGGGASDKLVECIASTEEICGRLNNEILTMGKRQMQIKDAIEDVEDLRKRELLKLLYIDGYRYEKVMVERYISRATFYRWHEQALDAITLQVETK